MEEMRVLDGLNVNRVDALAAGTQRLAHSVAHTLQHRVESDNDWYLIRTKNGCEKIARDHLRKIVDQTLLPLAKLRFRQQGRTMHRVGPVFPSYIFAYFSLGRAARQIRYTPGVRDVVRFGERAAVVPAAVIEDLIERCSRGPAELSERKLSLGSPLKVVDGPFRDFDAVFDGYLNGTDRVAVLLSLMNAERRAILPAEMVISVKSASGAVSL
jgi:transcriptional antiterminator RfaH